MTSPALENRRSLATDFAGKARNLHAKQATFGYGASFAARPNRAAAFLGISSVRNTKQTPEVVKNAHFKYK